MAVDFEKQVAGIADMIRPEVTLAPETTLIVTQSLYDIEEDFGPASDNPLGFHNAPHGVDVTRRAVRIGNILYPYILPAYQDRFFDGLMIGGGTHDRFQHLGPGLNEIASGEYAQGLIEAADGELNTSFFKYRVMLADRSTEVSMQPDGRLVQVNLRQGAIDPIKFGMGFADINGIAMEGDKRMWQDATNLYDELTAAGEWSVKGLFRFYVDQQRFLRHRLNDHQIKADIAYYLPDSVEDVYRDMRREYHDNIVSAHGLATLIGANPHLEESVGRIVGTVDRAHAGRLVGKFIRHLAASQ
jgi:hypothetical protein